MEIPNVHSIQHQLLQPPRAALNELRIALTLPAPDGTHGPTKRAVPLSAPVLSRIAPDAGTIGAALTELTKRGFQVTNQGRMSVSLRAYADTFESTFGTQLRPFLTRAAGAQFEEVLFPPPKRAMESRPASRSPY